MSFAQQYKTATLYFSRDSATIAAVIPAMDTLTNTLNPDTKESYHPSILAAMTLARKKMDRYYSLTDDSAAYRIAMGMSTASNFYNGIVTHFGFQFCIQASSSNTFASISGKKNGFSRRKTWYARNTSAATRRLPCLRRIPPRPQSARPPKEGF